MSIGLYITLVNFFESLPVAIQLLAIAALIGLSLVGLVMLRRTIDQMFRDDP